MIESKVAIIRAQGELYNDLKKGIEMVKSFDFREDDLIVIKPNLCDLNVDAVTKRDIVECLIRYIREKTNAPIKIVESNHWITTADHEFKYFGYDVLPDMYKNVELVNLSKERKINIAINGSFFETFDAPEVLLKATKFISVARLKTHVQQKMTCILKNQFGLIPEKYKSKYHPFMNKVLFDINTFVKPCLCVVDAREIMEGFGPSSGRIRKMDLILVGDQPEVVDSIAAELIGFEPSSVPYLKYSLGRRGASQPNITVVGEDIEMVKQKLEFVPFLTYFSYRLAFRIQAISAWLENFATRLAKFAFSVGLGIFLLYRKEVETLDHGLLQRGYAWRYIKGIMSKFWVVLKLKVQRIA